MEEINLLEQAPKAERRIVPGWRGPENRKIAREFGKDFFDGERVNGYGGYTYDGRWKDVVKKLEKIYGISDESVVLDVGCAKGFLMYDLKDRFPEINVAGIDVSRYALDHAMDGFGKHSLESKSFQGSRQAAEQAAEQAEERARNIVSPYMVCGSAENLPWRDDTFSVVLAINTLHNLPWEKCKKSLEEIERVCIPGGNKFVQVDAYRTESERRAMNNWNLTARTILPVEDWLNLFQEAGYSGDYFWTILDSKD